MPPRVIRRLPYTFPHRIIFIVSLVLCLCACASIVLGVVAWSKYLWGYYMGTGFWSGGIVLLGGMFGIVASYIRNICTVKTFMIISIFGCLASLAMIALAAGGLDPSSGFYWGVNKEAFMTHVIHSVYLGVGVLQLTLCVLSDGICIYYLFIEKSAQLYRVSDSGNKNSKGKGQKLRREGKYRSSTASEAPLVDGEADSTKGRNKTRKSQTHKNYRRGSTEQNNDSCQNDLPVPYSANGSLDRAALRRQELAMSKSAPFPAPHGRSASFSTFGRAEGALDHVSLIVHPTDDNASIADTVISRQTADPRQDIECHYAQTLLFGPPLPIEEDDELPPYELIETSTSIRSRKRGHVTDETSDTNAHVCRHSAPVNTKRKKGRFLFSRTKIPKGRKDEINEASVEQREMQDARVSSTDQNVVVRLSKSADLFALKDEVYGTETGSQSSMHEQGVACKSFAHSSDTILVLDQEVILRHKRSHTQSLRVDRVKRLDRRRKALSAEIKLNKDQLASHQRIISSGSVLTKRTNSFEGSNSSLLANNRIMPTKYSLRTPVRQVGMPHVCSPVPVKPIVDVPRITPPPKPPRNYSVTVEDLRDIDNNVDMEVENVFADINSLNKSDNDEAFVSHEISVNSFMKVNEKNIQRQKEGNDCLHKAINGDTSDETDKNIKVVELKEMKADMSTTTSLLSPEIRLDAGPVLKYKAPDSSNSQSCKDLNGKIIEPVGVTVEVSCRNTCDTMTLPVSPLLKPPSFHKHLRNTRELKDERMSSPAENDMCDVLVKSEKTPLSNKGTNINSKDCVDQLYDNDNVSSNVKCMDIEDNAVRIKSTVSDSMAPAAKQICTNNTPLGVTQVDNDKSLIPVDCGHTVIGNKYSVTESTPHTIENNTVYASVVKENVLLPSSPTTPVAKVQKAKRLTFSLTDNDVSVFDPLGNSKDQEAVMEVFETVSVAYPVDKQSESQSKENEVFCEPVSEMRMTDQPVTSAKSPTNNINTLSDLRVRLPPLSPSERILQRDTLKPDKPITSVRDNRPVILQPISVSKDSSRSMYGARPKTYEGLFAPLSPPKSAFQKPKRLKEESRQNIVTIPKEQETSKLSSPSFSTKDNSLVTAISPGMARTISTKVPLPASPYISLAVDSGSPALTSSESVLMQSPTVSVVDANLNVVPVPSTPQIQEAVVGLSPIPQPRSRRNSQGVLHLPQSQNFRHVTNNVPPREMQGAAPQHDDQGGQYNHIQQDNNQPYRPLFSKLL